jgi:hypothetical protein
MTNRKQSSAGRAANSSSSKPATGRGRSTSPRPSGSQGRARMAEQREQEAVRIHRTRRRLLGVVAIGVLALAGVLIGVLGSSTSTAPPPVGGATNTVSGPPGPEGVPLEEGTLLAPASTSATGQPVDGVQCNSNEQRAYHVHTHLSLYVDGTLRPLPAGIGIVMPLPQPTTNGPFDQASQCYYWLHVHAQDGVIHIESPAGRSYTLGDFFDLWRQPLSTDQLGPDTGTLTMFVNGRPYRGDPRTIPLGSHEDVQIDVGTPVVPPQRVDWSVTSL